MPTFMAKDRLVFFGQESTFGAGVADNALEYLEISSVDMALPANEFRLKDALTRKDDDDKGLLARVPREFAMEYPLCGIDSSWPASEITGDPPPPVQILEGVLEDAVGGGYGVTQTDSTGSLVKLDAGQGATFEVGQIIWVRTSSAAGYRMNPTRISDIQTDDMTVEPPLLTVPSSGDLVIGGWSLAKAVVGPLPSTYEYCLKGAGPVDVRRYLGSVVKTATLDIEPGSNPKLSLGMIAAKVIDPDDAILDGYEGDPDPEAWDYPVLSQAIDGEFFIYDRNGGDTYHLDGSIKLDFGIDAAANMGHSYEYPNGVREWVRTAGRITVGISPAYLDNALIALSKDPDSDLMLMVSISAGPEAFAFCLPQAVIKRLPEFGERDSFLSLEMEIGAKSYTQDVVPGAEPTSLVNASFVLAFAGGTPT